MMQPVDRSAHEENPFFSWPSPALSSRMGRVKVDSALLDLANRALVPPETTTFPTPPPVRQQPKSQAFAQLRKEVSSNPSPFNEGAAEPVPLLCYAVKPVVTVGRVTSKATEIVTGGIRQACAKDPRLGRTCSAVAKAAQSSLDIALELIPESVQSFVARKERAYEAHLKKSAEYLKRCGMEREETEHLYEGLFSLFSLLSIGKMTCTTIRGPVGYSKGYFEDTKQFAKVREVRGTLRRDLVVVQYHSDDPVGKKRSWKWFTSAREANRSSTIEEVMERLGLLPSWGERTHVTVAKIPKGKKIRFLCGPAGCQIDSQRKKIVSGEGMQIRFHTFDPKWIVETREIPRKK